MKQIRLKDKILIINCCESRIYHPEDHQCPIKNNDAHGDGDDGCNLGCDLSGKNIPDDCPLEDVPDPNVLKEDQMKVLKIVDDAFCKIVSEKRD